MMRQRKPRFLKPDTLLDNKRNKNWKGESTQASMMPPLLTPPYFLRTVKINIPLIHIVPPPTQK